MIRIETPYPPSVNHAWRTTNIRGRCRVYLSKEGRRFREDVCGALHSAGLPMLTCPVQIVVTLHAKDKRKRDIDNGMKALLDALQHGGVIANDHQVADLRIVRGEPVKGGKAIIEIRELNHD